MEQESQSKSRTKTVTRSQKKESIQEMKERVKREKVLSEMSALKIVDYYEKAHQSIGHNRKQTGIVYDDSMALHKCEWDPNYPENPDRYRTVLNRCTELGLVDRCKFIEFSKAVLLDITTKHADSQFNKLRDISDTDDLEKLEKEASNFDAIYFNKDTFHAACVAAGCVLSLVKAVCQGLVHNGMAIVRPPGHHAMFEEYCGYCYFNNVAIAAQSMLNSRIVDKILIVDFDVHHGQGTQKMFYNENRVLYFSIHRYEDGTFWPNLRESNFDFIGAGAGLGYNINVPLNATNLGDNDYLSIILHILLPVAYEFDPAIVIFSAGYDSCIGCPEGQMVVTPGFYGHLVTLLGGLANGKQAVCLEGGYYLPSLAEGAAMTLRALLDDPPATLPALSPPDPTVVEVINNLKFMLRGNNSGIHNVHVKYLSEPDKPPYKTRDCYPVSSLEQLQHFELVLSDLKDEYTKIKNGNVCFSYDEEMLEHAPESNHPENPDRLQKVFEIFLLMKHNERCVQVASQSVSLNLVKLVHGEQYVDNLVNGTYVPTHTDIYFNAKSINSILRSAGCLLSVVDSVMKGDSKSGAALIRPPGHHAEHSNAEGFCFVNNVAVAAKHILEKYKSKRVMILDFDIHHGNGTQHAFYSEEKVLYISIHKYNNGKFFPNSTDANYNKVGEGPGIGFNVNIPFNKDKMGDAEYLSVFHRIVLPIAYSYSPEVVIVSAGFDAGVHDTIGNYCVTPEAFAHFIQMLKPLAQGRIILALEGGYNITTLGYSMNMCVKALLGDPLPKLNKLEKIKKGALETIESVIKTQKSYWPVLTVDRKLPDRIASINISSEASIEKVVDVGSATTCEVVPE